MLTYIKHMKHGSKDVLYVKKHVQYVSLYIKHIPNI